MSMEDRNSKPADERDAADALANLAAGDNSESDDAPTPSEPDPFATLEQGQSDDQARDADEDESAAAVVQATGITADRAAKVRAAQQVVFARQQKEVYARSFKQTLIPLLLVVGGLVLAVAILSLYMVMRAPAGRRSSLLMLLTFLSFPLAGILLIGAWWLHREVK